VGSEEGQINFRLLLSGTISITAFNIEFSPELTAQAQTRASQYNKTKIHKLAIETFD
jgi:hypothetical protein